MQHEGVHHDILPLFSLFVALRLMGFSQCDCALELIMFEQQLCERSIRLPLFADQGDLGNQRRYILQSKVLKQHAFN